ncbi:hypothetical protein DD238_008372 [Peronospora effusa]|uniref:Uncharacterized protein n=1 Tax=Peronospora effusa TaxID=542832 RepID=A0A3M6V7R9_9STRA|nr:hypothetical protein DD238_008372 [Peronospora effusa]
MHVMRCGLQILTTDLATNGIETDRWILLGNALQTVTTEGDIWCFPCWRIYSLMIAFLGSIN